MTGFEIIIQVRQSALDWILRAQHRRGIMRHERTTGSGTRKSNLVLGRPRLTLIPSSGSMSEISGTLQFQGVFSDFSIVDAASPIASEVVNITAHSSTGFATAQNPTPYASGLELDLRWAVEAENITSSTAERPSEDTINTILGMMGEWRDRFPIPEVPGALPLVTSIAHRVISRPSDGEPILAVGLNTTTSFEVGFPEQLNEPLVSLNQDWVVWISHASVLASIESALREKFEGNLPPPHGSASIPLEQGVLERLDFVFSGDQIHFTGVVSASHATADFSFDATLALDGNGIAVYVGIPVVEVHLDFLASLANFFTGGDIADGVREAVSSGLQSNDISGKLSGFFSGEILARFASGGPLAALQIIPTLLGLEMHDNGVLLRGILSVPEQSAAPQLRLSSGPISPKWQQDSGTPGPATSSKQNPIDTTRGPQSAAKTASVMASGAPGLRVAKGQSLFVEAASATRARPVRRTLPSGPQLEAGLVEVMATPRRGGLQIPMWTVLLNGSSSWAPGEDLARYEWDFGDGRNEISSGPAMRAVTHHNFIVGRHVISLMVTDAVGRRTTGRLAFVVGQLKLSHLPESGRSWQACQSSGPLSLRFLVTNEGVAVSGAQVAVVGDGWSIETATGENGIAVAVVDFDSDPPLPPEVTSPLIVGKLRVSASKSGFFETTDLVWVYDCATTSFDATRPNTRVDDLREELVAIFLGEELANPRGPQGDDGWDPIQDGELSLSARTSISRAIEIVAELEMLSRLSAIYPEIEVDDTQSSTTTVTAGAQDRMWADTQANGIAATIEGVQQEARRLLRDLALAFVRNSG